MTLQESEKRRRTRFFHDEDDSDFERPRRRRDPRVVSPPVKYVFRVNGKPRPPAEVHARSFKLGEIVSTSEGPHKVVEVYWSGGEKRGWRADVLLRPVETEEKKPEKKPEKSTRSARAPARNRNQRNQRNQGKGKR
jgi:hypothetical protein